MADFALELSFDADGAAAVEQRWRALHDAGLPSQLDHRGMTNAPHLTLVAAREIPESVVEQARTAFSEMLPLTLTVRGLVVFGAGTKVTLALIAEPSREVADAVMELRAASPLVRHPVWTPHVTLGRRIPRERLPDAVAAVQAPECTPLRDITATRLRWWNPAEATIDVIAGK